MDISCGICGGKCPTYFFTSPYEPEAQVADEPAVRYPLLKRLGQPTFVDDPLTSLLGPAYQAMTEAALAAAFEPKAQVADELEAED